VRHIRAQLRIAGFWFAPADFANPAKRPDVGANATADQTQQLAVTISTGDKFAFNTFNEIHSAPIRSTFIHFKYGQLRLITLNDTAATKRNSATGAICRVYASAVTRGKLQSTTADLDINQYLFKTIERGKVLRRVLWVEGSQMSRHTRRDRSRP
jgi:hypothetical protein